MWILFIQTNHAVRGGLVQGRVKLKQILLTAHLNAMAGEIHKHQGRYNLAIESYDCGICCIGADSCDRFDNRILESYDCGICCIGADSCDRLDNRILGGIGPCNQQ